MPTTDRFEPGRFCWAELATSDEAGAREFYTWVFGWEADESPISGGGTYSTFTLGGRAVGGAYAQMEEERAQGAPPSWRAYVSVDDADGYAKRVSGAGGTVIAPAFDVMVLGRMAIVADPTGAALGLWQARSHHGFGVTNEEGAVDWVELLTPDVERATAFYADVFGWRPEAYEIAGRPAYTVYMLGERSVGGAMANPPGTEDVPPHWGLYFNVSDCEGAAAQVKGAGGQILFGPQLIETVGTFASCADAQGAAFGIIEPSPQDAR
jgi:predicted enzyme related to lactoylglutathione lyase